MSVRPFVHLSAKSFSDCNVGRDQCVMHDGMTIISWLVFFFENTAEQIYVFIMVYHLCHLFVVCNKEKKTLMFMFSSAEHTFS